MTTVRHISFSSSGGAGRVANQLVAALPNFGYLAELDVVTNNDVRSILTRHPIVAATALLDFFVVRSPNVHQLVSLTRKSVWRKPNDFLGVDLLHLHWTPGAISISDGLLSAITQPLVWTMHDMWPVTGGCHHALQCQNFTSGCSRCPVVRPSFRRAIENHAENKRRVISDIPNIVVCAPSQWLVRQIQRSYIGLDLDVRYVPNPIEEGFYESPDSSEPPSTTVKSVLESIPSDAFVVGLVAKNLDDPNKRLGVALNLIKGVSTGKNIRPVVLLLVGDTKVAKKIASAEIRHVGTLQSVVDRKFAYSRMDVLLSISEAETAPLVVDEALTCGTPVIVRDVGGSAESVLDGVTGFVCMSDDEIQRGLIHLINDSSLSSRMRLAAPQDDRHSINNVLRSYTQIYSELIERRGILEDN